jgi:phage/plasmid-associated DNA primase
MNLLRLEKFESVLNGITLYEPINMTILDKLLNSDLLVVNEEWNEEIQLKKYKSIIKDGKAIVKYEKSKNNPYGRSNAVGGLGLHLIRRQIRHTLSKDNFIDIDIENCHPVILYQICKANNIKHEFLKKYVDNRSHYLNMVMEYYKVSRDTAKTLFIRLLYGGGISKWKEENKKTDISVDLEFINDFKAEFKNICDIIKAKNPDLSNIIKKIKEDEGIKEYNLNGSVCSYFLQEHEIRILTEIYNYCIEKGYIKNNVCVLCSDGIMLEKNLININTITNELKELIKNKTSFDLNFTIKWMDEDIKDLDNHVIKSEYDILFDFSTGNLANYFKNTHKSQTKFIYNNGKLYYFNGVYWAEDSGVDKPVINNYIDEVLYIEIFKLYQKYELEQQNKKEDKNKELKEIKKNIQKLRNHKTRDNYIKDICCKITDNNIKWNEKHNLFCFNNKIFNIDENKFITPDPNDYINVSCGYDYNDKYDLKLIGDIEKLIEQIFPNIDIRNTYMTAISTSLSGLTFEKFIIANGQGGNGKGVLNELLMKSVGNYGYVIPSNLITNPLKTGSNPELANCQYKRLVIFREPDDKNSSINCASIKELTGGEEINARMNFSNNTKTKLCLTLLGEMNNKPKLSESGRAMERRLIDILFESKYVSQSEYDELDEDEKTNVYVGNIYYKTPEFKEKYKQALFTILTKYYQIYKNNNYQLNIPDCVKQRSMEYLQNSDEYYNFIDENYTKTDNKKDIIKLKELFEQYKNTDDYFNLSKEKKRENNYKNFCANLETNVFIRKFIKTDSDKTKVLTNYKLKEVVEPKKEDIETKKSFY